MGLNFNGTDIAQSDEVFFNGTSMGAVYLNGTKLWNREQVLTDTRTWCIDHYLYVKYDGNGNVQIAGAEPSGSVHTGRGDCGGYGQGWYTAVSFSTSGWSNIRIQVTGSSTGGGGGSYDTTIGVSSSLGNTTVGSAYGANGAQYPSISVTVTLT
jgi:hypothetical protein